MTKIQNFEFIECVVPQSSTGTKFFFPDQPQLRFTSLLNLVSYTTDSCTNSILSGNPLLSIANLKNTYLILYANDKECINRIPVMSLNVQGTTTASSSWVYNIAPFAGQQIVWSKSYIQSPVAYSSISGSNFSVVFGVYYA
jgi:hypothetical protein